MGNRATAVQFFNQAAAAVNDLSNPQRIVHAYQMFASACQQDETWFEPFFQAGNSDSDMNLFPGAIACWRRALECEADVKSRAKCMSNLSWRLHALGRTQEAFEWAQKAAELDDKLPYLWVNLACVYQTLDDAKKAVEAGQRGYELDPHDPLIETAYAFNLLFDRQLVKGLKHFEARFAYKLKNFMSYPYPKWTGEPDKTVYLVSDQGIGDTLSYARFVPAAAARAKYIHAYVQPELLRLFQYAFGGISNLNIIPSGLSFPPADVWTTFVSLPFALGLGEDEIRNTPQIQPPVFSIENNWRVSNRKLHVGVAWAGSPLNDIDRHRNIPVHYFLELCRVKGVQLYALQIGDRAQDMHNGGMAPVMRDLSPWIRDVTGTVSVLRDIDLVISVESALPHICAMVGKECWIPYSHLGRDYRLGLDGTDQIWSKHRVFRQGPDQDWFPVFMRICEALEERIGR